MSTVHGTTVIKGYVKTLPLTPGVYRMLDEQGKILYIGKAKSLKKRVSSYTHFQKLPNRIQRMVSLTRGMDFISTHTEVEALMLEANMIKKHKPPFNVLLRDGKSYAQIFISDHTFPRVTRHRGAKKLQGHYFGPFASGRAIRETLTLIYKVFKLRNCADTDFATRSRPCLQYHIKQCTAPCVAYISESDYQENVKHALGFLGGQRQEVLKTLQTQMKGASAKKDYEQAALFRDQIRALSDIHAKQNINLNCVHDVDLIGVAEEGGRFCIQVFFIRGGSNYGNHGYFPAHTEGRTAAEVLSAFLIQFYEKNQEIPPEILLSHEPAEFALVKEALAEQRLTLAEGRRVAQLKMTIPKRGERQELTKHAIQNAKDALNRKMLEQASQRTYLRKLQELFNLEVQPERVEVYDNSHTQGSQALGAMIVAGPEGFEKTGYRKFNIKSEEQTPGDDYAMMREVIHRRFHGATEGFPDLLLIDGGKGQLSAVCETLREIEKAHLIPRVVAISKGPDRNAGREDFHQEGKTSFQLPEKDPTLYYLQRLRDEAHRFAISGHRARRTKTLVTSKLDEIPGIGAKRKKALLQHFGSAKNVERAAVKELMRVDGVSKALAQEIYDFFHEG